MKVWSKINSQSDLVFQLSKDPIVGVEITSNNYVKKKKKFNILNNKVKRTIEKEYTHNLSVRELLRLTYYRLGIMKSNAANVEARKQSAALTLDPPRAV